MDLLDQLLEHDRWATTQMLESSRGLTDAQLDQEFDIGLRSLRATYDHVFFNIEFWTRVAKGEPTDGIERDKQSIAVLIERHNDTYDSFTTFVRRMRDEDRHDDTFVDHFGGNMTFGGMAMHLVLHNAEHRSEILHMLNRLDVPDLPEIDHALWDQAVRRA